jgi:two-component system response regulator YesN
LIVEKNHFFNGLARKLQQIDPRRIVVYKVHSGLEAMELLVNTRMDIIVSDIDMPGVTGLNLVGLVEKLWPESKMLALVSHNDDPRLSIVSKSSIYTGFIDKEQTADTMAVIVTRLLRQIEQDRATRDLSQDTEARLKAMAPSLHHFFLWEAIRGSATQLKPPEETIDGGINPGQPMLVLLGIFKDFDTAQQGVAEQVVADVTLGYEVDGVAVKQCFMPTDGRVLWLLQPAPGSRFALGGISDERFIRMVRSAAQIALRRLREQEGMQIVFAISMEMLPLKRIHTQIERLEVLIRRSGDKEDRVATLDRAQAPDSS